MTMYTENMKHMACIVPRLNNRLDNVFKVKFIILRSKAKGQNDLVVQDTDFKL